MKILMINVVCGIRSTGRICTDLATALEAQGHEVKIAYGRENVPEQFRKYAVRVGSELDVKLHVAKARLTDSAGFGSKAATTKFIKWVKEYDPDVIHLHNIHGYYINIEILFDYLKTCDKKIIWTLHDCWAFTGHTAYCDAVHCEKWKTGCNHCPQHKEYPQSYIDRSKINWKRKKDIFSSVPGLRIVTPSHWLKGLVKDSFLKEYDTDVIHNGIDTSQFYPLKNDFREVYGIGNRVMLLGVATIWDDMKGYSDFIALSHRLPFDKYSIVLVGLTEKQRKELSTKIIGIERTASVKELAQIYSAADLFLNLTYCDNYPTVNIEAAACGTPIISYDTGGSPESAGSLLKAVVPKGDIEQLVTVIEKYQSYKKTLLPDDASIADEIQKNDKAKALRNYLQIYSTSQNSSGGGYFELKNKYNLVGKSILLGVAAVWDYRKGLEDFIELKSFLNENYQIMLVGLSKLQIEKLPENIIGIERTNSVLELAELYSVADVFVNPTYEDNYPTTNIEAIACGTPVITYDTGGSVESAKMYGLIVPKKNIGLLDKAIENIGKIEPRKIDIDNKDAVRKYVELYEEI